MNADDEVGIEHHRGGERLSVEKIQRVDALAMPASPEPGTAYSTDRSPSEEPPTPYEHGPDPQGPMPRIGPTTYLYPSQRLPLERDGSTSFRS